MSSWRKSIDAFYLCHDDCAHDIHPCDLDWCDHCVGLWDDLIERAESEVVDFYKLQGRDVIAYADTVNIDPPDFGKYEYRAHVLVTTS